MSCSSVLPAVFGLLTTPLFLSANYYLESASTPLEDPDELALESIAIVGEQILDGGLVLVEIAAEVRNLGEAAFENVGMQVAHGSEFAEGVVEGIARFSSTMAESLAAGALSTASDTFRVVVDPANLGQARNAILTGAVFITTATDTFGAVLQNAVGLVIEEIVILTETTLADGRILIEFTARVRNVSAEVLAEVIFQLGDLAANGIDGLLNERATYPEVVDPLELVTTGETLHAIVAPADVESFKTEVVIGSNLSVSSSELWIFSQPPAGVDAETEAAWEGTAAGPDGTIDLVYFEETSFLSGLAPGQLLIEVPAIHRLSTPEYVNPFNPPDETPPPVLSERLPFEVEAILTIGDKIHVRGRQRNLLDVVVSGTFRQDFEDAYDGAVRDPYKPELGNTHTEEEKAEREAIAAIIREENPRDGRLADLDGMEMIPWHFNDVEISPKIRMSGEVLVRSSGVQMEVKIRNASLEKVSASLALGGEFNILLETEDEADNRGANENERSLQLFYLPLPPVTFNLGGVPVSLQPVVSLDAGVEAVTPSRLYLPLQSSFTVGMEMGWNESSGTYYTPLDEVVPLRISDPSVFEDTAASVGAWVELGVMLDGSIAEVVNGGPSLALRASTAFELTPLLDPWWDWNLSVDLLGRFNLSFLGIEVFEEEDTIHTIYDLDRDAGGPLIPPLEAVVAAAEAVEESALKPLAGRETRWARAFQHTTASANFDFDHSFVLHDPAGFLIVGGSSKVQNAYAKYTLDGDLLWTRQFQFGPKPRDAVLEDDGSFTMMGIDALTTWIARFDPDGEMLWSRRYEGFTNPLEMVRTMEEEEIVYYICGHLFDSVARDYDPVLLKFGRAGELLFAKRYRNPGEDDKVVAVAVFDDSDVGLSGSTTQDVEPPSIGTPAPGNVLLNASTEGLLMRLATDGSVQWANAYVGRHAIEFSSLAEGNDGTLYVGGHHHRPISEDQPNLLFGRFDADGTLRDHVLIGKDAEWIDDFPGGGNTPYDLVGDLRWLDDALWACGSTGLGEGSAAWLMKLTPELGCAFYSVFDGVHTDAFASLADTGTGVAVWGPTQSFHPWREGGEGANLLQVIPYEGILRYNESSLADSLFLQPWVYKSSGSDAFYVYSELATTPPQRVTNDTSPVPFLPEDLSLTESTGLSSPVVPDPVISSVLQATSPALIDDLASWEAYYGIASLPDDQAFAGLWAAHLGLDPWALGFSEVSGLTHELQMRDDQLFLTFNFDRRTLVDDLSLGWESSLNLLEDSWSEILPDSFHITPLNDEWERVEIEFALDDWEGFLRRVMRPEMGP